MSEKIVPVGISARHVHVSREHLDILFGKDYQLTIKKDLSQPGQFASNETVDLVTEKSTFKNVRILGPERKVTQVELSMTDAMKLGLRAPVRDSGDIKGSPGLSIVGPQGTVKIEEGVIVACRHIHMTPADAEAFGVKDKEVVRVKCEGERALIFDKVLIRVNEQFKLEMHVDTDEGNAALLSNSITVKLDK